MYLRYAERQGWKTEVLDATESDLGGYKAATIAVRGRRDPKPWSRLKYEGGVHRVQRVPVTEAQGRLHTSAVGVLVLPEAEEVEVEIDPNDLRIDVYRSSGPGGQSVNTTDSAVRITHVPTGIVVSCQNEKSQLQNKESAMRILRARLLAAAQEQADAEASAARRSQVRTVDRSERIRTYNFPENRISDHRVNFKAYNLDAVLDGDLDAVVQALSDADTEQKMGGLRVTTERQVAVILAEAGIPSARHDARVLVRHAADHALRRSTTSSPRGRRGSRCSTSSARPASATSTSRSVRASSCRARRPSCSSTPSLPRSTAVTAPVVVDLCAGSGAIGLSVAHEHPRAVVHLVERSDAAFEWLERNTAEAADRDRIHLHHADLADAPAGLDGAVDVVVVQPAVRPARRARPGRPRGARPRSGRGAVGRRRWAGRDPPGGGPGASRCCGPAACWSSSTPSATTSRCRELLSAAGFAEVTDHRDLTGRPRFSVGVAPC